MPRQSEHYYLLAAKLATFSTVQKEVRDHLVEALATEELRVCDLEWIAQVDDLRIRRWFARQIDSPNRDIRAVANRVVKRGQHLPRGVSYAITPPNRQSEIYSTEVEIWDVEPWLRRLAKEYSLRIPAGIRKASFLAAADVDRWVLAPIMTKRGENRCIWFRLEDTDTVELVVTAWPPEESLRPV